MEIDSKYQAILLYLFSQFPQYQRVGGAAYKSGLEGMEALDRALDAPHKKFRSIHVAGTNGKGSVSHMLAAILQCAGYRVGLYTSPHLVDFRERIRINGVMIPKEEVLQFVGRYKPLLDEVSPSFFEITTAMAFDYFTSQKVDIAVVETGLGGRLDSTNVMNPILSIITNIGLDHCELLGNTLPLIAAEKAGIIKPHTPVVIGERHPLTDGVFAERAERVGAPLFFAQDLCKVERVIQEDNYQRFIISGQEYCSDLKGSYQQKNIPVVIMATRLLEGFTLHPDVVKRGLREAASATGLRGRWECISKQPKIIVDAAHNAHGIRWVADQLKKEPYKQLHFVFGVVAEKNLDAILPLLPQDARYYFTQAQIPRALDVHLLAGQSRCAGLKGEVVVGVREALAAARAAADPNDLIFVGGSMFVVAEAIGLPEL